MDTIVTPVTVITLDSTRIVHNVKADFTERFFPPVVRLVQYDQSLPVIAVSLMQNGQAYTLPSGAAANIRVHKPDATYVYNPALGCDSTRKIVYFEVTQAMAAANGDGLAIVEIVVDGDIAGTSLITLHFEENPVPEDAIESSDEWETIYELGERIIASTVTPVSTAAGMTDHNVVYLYTGTESGWNQGHMYYYNGTTWVDAGIASTDATLSVQNMAADAKATGDAIADLKDGLSINDLYAEKCTANSRWPRIRLDVESDTYYVIQILEVNGETGYNSIWVNQGSTALTGDIKSGSAANFTPSGTDPVYLTVRYPSTAPSVVPSVTYYMAEVKKNRGVLSASLTNINSTNKNTVCDGNISNLPLNTIFGVQAGTSLVDEPFSTYYIIVTTGKYVSRTTGDTQIAFEATTGDIATRTYNGTAWTPWVRYAKDKALTDTNNSIGVSEKFLKLLYTPVLNGAFHINKTINTSDASYKHLDYTLQGERYLYITGNPYSASYPLYIFLDANDNVISYQQYSGGDAYIVDEFVDVPANAYRVVVNGKSSNNQNNIIKTYDKAIRSSLESLPSDRINCDVVSVGTKTTGKAHHINGSDASNDTYEYISLDLNGGENLIINGYNFANSYPAFMIYHDDTIIYKGNYGNNGVAVKNVCLTMPDDATKIIVNGSTAVSAYSPALINTYGTDYTLKDLYYKIKPRKYVFIGDSYLEGYNPEVRNSGWGVYLVNQLGLSASDYIINYKGGAGFSSANGTKANTFLNLLKALDYAEDVTDVVCCGGYNDQATAHTTTEILTGIREFCEESKKRFPNALVSIGFVGWNKQGTGSDAPSDWSSIHSRLLTKVLPAYQTCTQYSYCTGKGCRYLTNIEYWINDDTINSTDGFHPTELGNQRIAMGLTTALLTGSAPLATWIRPVS